MVVKVYSYSYSINKYISKFLTACGKAARQSRALQKARAGKPCREKTRFGFLAASGEKKAIPLRPAVRDSLERQLYEHHCL